MLTRLPNPFMLGIVIGAMLHLLVLPWLTQTHANAQTGQAPWQESSDDPPTTVEYAGLRFVVPEGMEAFYFDHLVIRHALMGETFPVPGSLVTANIAVIGVIESLRDDSALTPGATHRGRLMTIDGSAGAELYVLTSLHLGEERVEIPPNPAAMPVHRGETIDASVSVVSMIVETEHGVMGVDTLVATTERGGIFLPMSAMTDGEVSAAALAGATDHFELFEDPIGADLVLYGAHELGFETEGFMYLTETVYQMTLGNAPPPGVNPLAFKTCDYCACGTFSPGSAEYQRLCTMRSLARELYKDQMQKAKDDALKCIAKSISISIGILITTLVCVGVSGGTLTVPCLAILAPGFGTVLFPIGCAGSLLLDRNAARDCFKSRLEQVCILICGGILPTTLPSSPLCN